MSDQSLQATEQSLIRRGYSHSQSEKRPEVVALRETARPALLRAGLNPDPNLVKSIAFRANRLPIGAPAEWYQWMIVPGVIESLTKFEVEAIIHTILSGKAPSSFKKTDCKTLTSLINIHRLPCPAIVPVPLGPRGDVGPIPGHHFEYLNPQPITEAILGSAGMETPRIQGPEPYNDAFGFISSDPPVSLPQWSASTIGAAPVTATGLPDLQQFPARVSDYIIPSGFMDQDSYLSRTHLPASITSYPASPGRESGFFGARPEDDVSTNMDAIGERLKSEAAHLMDNISRAIPPEIKGSSEDIQRLMKCYDAQCSRVQNFLSDLDLYVAKSRVHLNHLEERTTHFVDAWTEQNGIANRIFQILGFREFVDTGLRDE